MKRTNLILSSVLCLLASLSHAQTSDVQTVKAWRRTHVMGIPGGTLRDPTGTIAEGQRLAAAQETIAQSSNIIAAANTGLTNALVRLYDAAARTNDFTGRLYLAADSDSDPDYENVEGYVVHETLETNGVHHYFTHYTRELDAQPETLWKFDLGAGDVFWVTGTVATNNATTNVLGYACYDIAVQRPAAAGPVVLRTHKFLKFGAPQNPLRINGLRLICGGVTNTPFTGSVAITNEAGPVTNEIIKAYESGFLQSIVTNSIGGIP